MQPLHVREVREHELSLSLVSQESERSCGTSNFPMDKASMPYHTCWQAFKRTAAAIGLSAEEKADIFHDTAARVYRLGPTGKL